jgi:glutamyl-Q tRNA(Asp) synthetase
VAAAPSPSGPLHFGSIVTALGSYLQAKSNHGRWFLRVEDIDIPRTRSGAREDILQTLDKLGLHWDGEPVIQSQREKEYNGILTQLADRDLTYPCICPRRDTRGAPLCRRLSHQKNQNPKEI